MGLLVLLGSVQIRGVLVQRLAQGHRRVEGHQRVAAEAALAVVVEADGDDDGVAGVFGLKLAGSVVEAGGPGLQLKQRGQVVAVSLGEEAAVSAE